jgi:protein transport protein SEC61 subunit gamma and related proteins
MTKTSNNRKEKEENVVAQLTEFAKNSKHFFEKCRKPDKEEYFKIMYACFMGFVVMGFIGYAVKLIFIPINNILLSN